MTYLLAITLCALTSPVDAKCVTTTGYLRAKREQCEELRKPMLAHVISETELAGMRVLFIGVRCERGLSA